LLIDRDRGGVKIVTTDTTGKSGTNGRSFVCPHPSPTQGLELIPSEGGVREGIRRSQCR